MAGEKCGLAILLALPFGNDYYLIHMNIVEHVDVSARPADLEPVDPLSRAQAEVKSGAVVALVPPAAMEFIDQAQIPGHDSDASPHRIAISLDPAKLDLEPVVFVR